MRNELLRTASIVLALLGGAAVAVAQQSQPQQSPPAVDAAQQEQQERAQQTPSGQTGKEEPSSHAPSATPSADAVFVNGALAVPGAPESDTVPAKFSEKNAADDKLITVAYTFKNLTGDERRAVFEALKDQPAGSAYNADVGDELPFAVELRPVPSELVARVPQTKDYQFTVADNRVLLVSPPSRIVVGSFPDPKEIGATVGRRGQ